MNTNTLKIKRSYEPEEPDDGARILVDRLWPRGESKVRADLSEWDKAIAPSAELRKAFHQGTIPYEQFKQEYLQQLDHSAEAESFAAHIRDLLEKGNVTLLYASKNPEQNNAVVLLEWLHNHLKAQPEEK